MNLVLISIIYLILAIGFYYFNQSQLIALTLVIFIVHFLFLKFKKYGIYVFNPISLFAISTVITSLSNFTLEEKYNKGESLAEYGYAIPDFFLQSNLIYFIGFFSILAGYEISKGNFLKTISIEFGKKNKYFFLIFISTLALSFKQFWLSIQLPGALGSIVDLFPLFSIIFLSRIGYKWNNNKLRNYALALTIIQTIINVLFSYLRFEMIAPFLVYFLGMILGGASIMQFFKLKFIPAYLLAFAFFLFFGTFGAQRSAAGFGVNRLIFLSEAKQTEIEVGIDEDRLTPFTRSSNLAQISNVVQLTESNGFYEGLTFKQLAISLIPRFVWPDKPLIALGAWFAVEIGQAIFIGNWYNTSINMTIPGELYLNFGWLGLIIGCCICGIYIKQIWNSCKFWEREFNFTGTILGGYLLLVAFTGLGSDLQIIITILAYYLIFLVIKIFYSSAMNT